ncbi:MAG: AraC family transcriptional regulator [Pseudomonadota bacterium]
MTRAGLRHRGGNLTEWMDGANGAPRRSAAWTTRDLGLFVVNEVRQEVLEVDTVVTRDVLACGAVLNDAATSAAVGNERFEADASNLIVVYLPRGERFQFATRSARGLASVTLVADLKAIVDGRGLAAANLPASLRAMMQCRQSAMMDRLTSAGAFGRIAQGLLARRNMYPSLASLYYEGKTYELLSALLCQLAEQDGMRERARVADPRLVERLARVKHAIDRAPHRRLNIDALERAAAMNRTKLRSAFKRLYGATLSEYRTALLMTDAENFLSEPSASVQEAAHRAGYATASAFIVAYKRHFGVRPGALLVN